MVARTRVNRTVRVPKLIPTPSLGKKERTKILNTARSDARAYIENLLSTRSEYAAESMDGEGRNLDKECGYPEYQDPTVHLYVKYYERGGIPARVNDVFPDECWSVHPQLYETEKNRNTAFEQGWKDLLARPEVNPWHYLHRADRISGRGRFGIVLLGLSDPGVGRNSAQPFASPAPGINDRGEMVELEPGKEAKLLYLRVFGEECVQIVKKEENPSNPRYDQPTLYRITMVDPRFDQNAASGENKGQTVDLDVHWTRVIHVADNRESSEVIGTPRMKKVLNYLFDIRKVLGGSAEMFWKGGFPGYAVATDPALVGEAELDKESVKEEMTLYFAGLQRYVALEGMKVQSLNPQIGDPTAHMTQLLIAVCATIGVPLPVFLGQVEGHMAGTQNMTTWNRRLSHRQTDYLEPHLIRPFVLRLQAVGVLKRVSKFIVTWKDLNALADKDKAEYAVKMTQALLQYVTSGTYLLIRPVHYLVNFLKFTEDEAWAMVEASAEGKKGDEAEDAIILKFKDQAAMMNPPPAQNVGGGSDPAKKTGMSGNRNGKSSAA